MPRPPGPHAQSAWIDGRHDVHVRAKGVFVRFGGAAELFRLRAFTTVGWTHLRQTMLMLRFMDVSTKPLAQSFADMGRLAFKGNAFLNPEPSNRKHRKSRDCLQ